MSRYRLYPTPAQEAVLRDHCGHARYVWNLAVEQHSHWHPGRRDAPGYLEQCRQLTQAEAADVPSRGRIDRLPPQSFFLVSAIFHYLGPSLAVLLFTRVDVLGVAWLRIASAAVVFVLWRRPWRLIGRLGSGECRNLLALGLVLAVMNSAFYLAVDRLPLSAGRGPRSGTRSGWPGPGWGCAPR